MALFDDVSLPAVVFVGLNMFVSLAGNTLVLLVFGCRWLSTNDTKIYILSLAALDLVCSVASSPRDLISLLPESQCLVKVSDMKVYCKVSVYISHSLNVASAIILVAIGVSRYVKVTRRDASSSKVRGRGACKSVKAAVRRGSRAVSTVRGAKISSAVALCFGLVHGLPLPIIYGSGDSHAPPPSNASGTVFNGTAEDANPLCHSTCRDNIHADLRRSVAAFDISQFALFVILTVTLMSTYAAILQNLCCKNGTSADFSGSARRDSAFFPDQPLNSSLTRLDKIEPGKHTSEHQSPLPAEAAPNVGGEGESSEAGSPTSVHGLVMSKDRTTPGGGAGDGTAQTRKKEPPRRTLLHSLSHSSGQGSDVPLDRQTSQAQESRASSRRLSTASFQLTRTGNTARLTTLVFLLVSLIYILSYFPYFFYVLVQYLGETGAVDPWQQWGVSGRAVLKICRRSYLMANAANPLVYGLCNPYFREQLGKLLCCRRDVI